MKKSEPTCFNDENIGEIPNQPKEIQSESFKNIKIERREGDLMPQATMLACIILDEIIANGRYDFADLKDLARIFDVNIDSVLLRLPMIRLAPIQSDMDPSSPPYLELQQEVVINPHSPGAISIPSALKDALLNARDSSTQLYLTFASKRARYDKINLPDGELAEFFINWSRTISQPIEIRLVALSQAIVFSDTEDAERYRRDAVHLLLEYHRYSIPIHEYFQSFTKQPVINLDHIVPGKYN